MCYEKSASNLLTQESLCLSGEDMRGELRMGKMRPTERIRGIARTPARRPLVPLWTVLEVFVAVSYVAEEVYLVASREEGSSDRVYGRVTPALAIRQRRARITISQRTRTS